MKEIKISNANFPASAQGSGFDLLTHRRTRRGSRQRHKQLLSLGVGWCSCCI